MARWFDIAPGERYFCVVGSPVAHSKSPVIHQAFAAEFGISMRYEKVTVLPGDLAKALEEFHALGGTGLNVTVPLKQEAYEAAHVVRPRAGAAQAANTLWFDRDGALVADNTDGVGLVRDLTVNLGFVFAGKHVLVVGAGGAARGAVPVLLETDSATITVVNRTVEKARVIASRSGDPGRVSACAFEALAGRTWDLIINCTSSSLQGGVPPLPPTVVGGATWCYDTMYGPRATPFVEWARSLGAIATADGVGMLVEQAAESFFLWHALRPQTAPVIAALRSPGPAV